MEKYILEASRKEEETFDKEKVKFISSKIPIWDLFGVPQSSYLNLSVEEKSAMFKQYYEKLVSKYHGKLGKLIFCLYCLTCVCCFCLVLDLVFGLIFF